MNRELKSDGMQKKGSLPWRRTALWTLLAGTSWGLVRAAQMKPEWVESYYSRGLYPYLRQGLSACSGWVPISVAGILLTSLLGGWLVWSWMGFRKARRGDCGFARLILAGLLRMIRWSSIGVFTFGGLWGLNHARQPLSLSANLPPIQDKGPGLEILAEHLVEALIRDQAQGLAVEGFAVVDARGHADARISEALEASARLIPSLGGESPVLRPLPFWSLFARLGISGIFIPFTGEAHFNGGVPACRRPFVALHEVAHQRGFAREDEANFLGWLACAQSGDAHYRYSGNLAAFSMVLGPLYGQDADLARSLQGRLPGSVLADMRAVRAFWKSYESPARSISIKVNDIYLKSQGQSHGVRSYGRMVELMLSYHQATGL